MIVGSTGWNVERRGSLFAAAEELMAMGFEGVLLHAPVGVADAGRCGDRLKRAKVKVAGARAPLVAGRETADAHGGLASLDDRVRARAVEALLQSARAAMDAATGLVLLDGGVVPVEGAEDCLPRWKTACEKEGRVGEAVLEEAAALRARRAALRTGPVEALLRSLHAACRAFPDTTFAVTVPGVLHGIPDLGELEILLSETGARNLAWAHDTGRAAVRQSLGGEPAAAWLAGFGGRCAAVLLNDAAGLEDRLPPGAGTLRWGQLAGELPTKCVRALEVHPRWPREMLLEGLNTVESMRSS